MATVGFSLLVGLQTLGNGLGQRLVALGIRQIDRGLGRLHGLAELAAGGLGRGQRVDRQRILSASSCLPRLPGQVLIASSGSRMLGFGTGGKDPGQEVPGLHRFLVFAGGFELSAELVRQVPPLSAAAARPARAKDTSRPRDTRPARTAGRPAIAAPRRSGDSVRAPAAEISMASSDFLRAMAILAKPKQAWLKLLIVSAVLDAFRCSFRISR